MKRFVLFFIVFVIIFSISSCGILEDEPEETEIITTITGVTLTVPQNILVLDNVIHWNSVPNATGYIVSIDNVEYVVNDLSFEIPIEKSKDIEIRVKAIGNTTTTLDSNWSEIVMHELVKATPVLDSYKTKLLNESIGRTINVITGEYAVIDASYQSIFNTNMLYEMTLVSTPLRRQNAESVIQSTMESFIIDLNVKYQRSLSAQIPFDIFTLGASNVFNLQIDGRYGKNTSELFYTLYQNIIGNRIEIEGYRDHSKFTEALSNGFIIDIEKLEDGLISPNTIINKYGTHAVVAGLYGGRIQCYYYSATNNTSFNVNALVDYKRSIDADILDVISGSSSTTFNIDFGFQTDSSRITESFYAEGIGGRSIALGSKDLFAQNYNNWANSFLDNQEYSVLIDFPEQSLIKIWDLLPLEYSHSKSLLDEELNQLSESTYIEFINKYDYSKEGDDIPNGFNPIYTADDLYNIRNSPSSNYYLMENIDLSGNYFLPINSFSGIFDGNNRTIHNFILNVPAINNPGNIGLFSEILESGVVKNLTLSDVISTATAKQDGESFSIATLAGVNNGLISNVTVDSVNFGINRGKSHLGGIVGKNNGTITNVVISNSSLFNNGNIGGIVSLNYGQVSFASAINMTLTHWGSATNNNKSVGGIVATNYELATISDSGISGISLFEYRGTKHVDDNFLGIGNVTVNPRFGYVIGTHRGSATRIFAELSSITTSNIGKCSSQYWFSGGYDGKIGRLDGGVVV